MATSVILDKKNGLAQSVSSTSYPIASASNKSQSSVIIDEPYKSVIREGRYLEATPSTLPEYSSVMTGVLPFRVAFTTLGIESYGPNNPPPIGIAIIGYNNYIL